MSIFRKFHQASRSLSGLFAFLLVFSLITPTRATVFTNGASITLTDATTIGTGNPYPSTITVSGMTGTVTNVTVRFNNMNHTFTDDFDILLAGPTGANLIVQSDVGGSDDIFNQTITYDDAASGAAPDATFLGAGTYKPTNIGAGDTWNAPAPAPSANTTFAAAFNGTDPNGVWSLYVADDLGVDMGTIGNGWTLTVTTSGTTATSFSNFTPIQGGDGARSRVSAYPSTITASGLTGAITDVNVTLTGLSHLNPDDLDIVLVSPAGKRLMLLSDAGGTADVVNQTVTFDDSGAATIPDAGPLVAGTFKPTNFGTGDTVPDLTAPYPNSTTAGTATLASVFNGTNPNGTWKLYITDDATTSDGTLAGGWSLDITAGGTFGAKRFTSSDFDGDGRTDASVIRNQVWYWRTSTDYENKNSAPFGLASDTLAPADYDGDGKTDLAVFRPSLGAWFVLQSSNSTLVQTFFGTNGDTPVAADYDGDGKADRAVYRGGATARWYVLQSATSTLRVIQWGTTGDVPVRGYFNGTNGADFTVFRPSENNWYIQNNAATLSRVVNLGASGDTLAAADYDGDGSTDAAVYRPSLGDWYILLSTTGAVFGTHLGAVAGDTPVPGDFDGDSKADVAIWKSSTGTWYIINSGTPPGAAAFRLDNWGLPGDTAVPSL